MPSLIDIRRRVKAVKSTLGDIVAPGGKPAND